MPPHSEGYLSKAFSCVIISVLADALKEALCADENKNISKQKASGGRAAAHH